MERARWIAFITSLPAAFVLVAATWLDVLAQTPLPTPRPGSGTMGGGVTASVTGDPILAAVGVIALGLATTIVTVAVAAAVPWVRPRHDA